MGHIQFDEEKDLVQRRRLWECLVEGFFNNLLSGTLLLEIGSGWGEFLKAVQGLQKYAIDIEPSFARFVRDSALFSVQSATNLAFCSNTFDVVFASHILEHMRTREDIVACLREAYRVLAPGGKVIILGPNFKFCYRGYYDFFDHYIALTEQSVSEAILGVGFKVDLVVSQFLPFSTKSRLPQWPILIHMYLKFPLAWRFLGQQFLVVGHKPQ